MILLGWDLSQVEFRIELMLAAGVPKYAGSEYAREAVRIATAAPWEFDVHTWVAAVALDKSEKEVTKEDRNIAGKPTGHGFSRGMGADTMSNSLLKKGYVVPPEVCARRLSRVAAKLPLIPDGYFPDIRQQLMRFRGLGTTWGAIWRCDDSRLEEHLYGTAYSFPPVRETLDLINQRGFLPLVRGIELRRLHPIAERPAPRLHIHGHDSLLASVHPDDAYPVAAFVDRTLAKEVRYYAAGALQVPVTYQLGETWEPRYEYKRLPSEKEFRDAAWDCERHAQAMAA